MSAKDFKLGQIAGLEKAERWVMSAPLLQHGQRKANIPGGFPRMADPSMDADGDPDFVACNYALRDAILFWIERDLAELRGEQDE